MQFQEMNSECMTPAPSQTTMYSHQPEQTDHHPRLDRNDLLERTVRAELHRPGREQVVEGRHQRQQHEEPARHRKQSQVEVTLAKPHL
jgi:hypothetical protein